MLDEHLVGYWSDEAMYMGSMEAADIAFRSDGTCWTYWTRDGGSYYVVRFGWHTDASGNLILDLHEQLHGIREPFNHTGPHRVSEQRSRHERISLAYEITAGHNAFRDPATLLRFDQKISVGTIGDRFAFKRELVRDEQDPTIRSSPKR
jgi:hypothetical protein